MDIKFDNRPVVLSHIPTEVDPPYSSKEDYEQRLIQARKELSQLQTQLVERPSHGVLVIFQAMDAAGKDGTIQAVFQGIHPMGLRFISFKRPSETELRHDFMWRCVLESPERGQLVVFNRSYYEEVLVVRVHKDKILPSQGLPPSPSGEALWQKRYEAIRQWEDYMTWNGFKIIKFFLHVSKKEQGKRLIDRLTDPSKHFKFQPGDLEERDKWDTYQLAYQEMFQHTSTEVNPWHIIPADDKRTMRLMVVDCLLHELKGIVPNHEPKPAFTQEQIEEWIRRIEDQNKK